MTKNSTNHSTRQSDEPKMGKTILEDLKKEDFKTTLKQDFNDLKEFYISEERKKRLEEMGFIKKYFFMFVWLMKSLFFKLTPVRRILIVTSVILIIISEKIVINEHVRIGQGTDTLGFILLLFVLMLELKDKLLAHYELQAGRYVQDELMPEQTPEIPGWSAWLYTRPANDVGGDLLDFLKVTGKRFGIALGDVSGKGLRAALLMAKLQSTLRALLPDFISLSKLGTKINQIFFRDSLSNVFASMIYLELTSEDGMIRYINAGHMPPVVLKESSVEQLPKGDAALGIMSKAKYKENKLKLNKDELLIVYSDGITEARNESGEFYGEERFLNIIKGFTNYTPQEAGGILLNEIEKFAVNTRPNDDISIIILKRVV